MLKALIVDDSRSARFSLKKSLEKLSVLTEEAGSGQEALLLLQRLEYTPDIIFMDHYMPDLDGFEVTKRLRAGKWPQIPIIMCSSKDDPDYHQEALAIGANGTVAKPAKHEEIEVLIENIQKKILAAPLVPVVSTVITPPQLVESIVVPPAAPPILMDEDKITAICQSLVSFHFTAHQLYLDQKINETIQAIVATQLDARLNVALEETMSLKADIVSTRFQKNETALSDFQHEIKQQLKGIRQEIEAIQPTLESELSYDDHAIRQSIDKISKEISIIKQSHEKEKSANDYLNSQIDSIKKHLAQNPSRTATTPEKDLSKELSHSLSQLDKALQKETEKRSSGLEQLNEKIQLIENKMRHEVKLLLEYSQQKQHKTQILIYSLIGVTVFIAILGIMV
jgi:two-component system, cell cycle response regulator